MAIGIRTRAVRQPRRAAADNLWAPPPTFVDRRAAAADNLSARRRCHCCCVAILLQFSMTKTGHQTILRVERNFNTTTSGLFSLVPVPSLAKGEGSAILFFPPSSKHLRSFGI